VNTFLVILAVVDTVLALQNSGVMRLVFITGAAGALVTINWWGPK
jgi:hypothetical protein